MAKVKLPQFIDPIKSASKRSTYVGFYAPDKLERLTDIVAEFSYDVNVKVEFKKDAQSLTYFNGNIETQAQLICQRCNKLFTHMLDVDFCYSPVQGQELDESELPEAYEPVEVNDHGEVDLLQIIEDELILSLPIVALHAEEDCDIKAKDLTFGKIEPEQERRNPFEVLKELKRD